MAQDSIYYAAGRLSVLRKNILDQTKLERVLQADSFDAAASVLSELGWSCDGDWEQCAQEHFCDAVKLVKELNPDSRLTDACLLRYDINNLKILFKARCLNTRCDELSSCGIYAPEKLTAAVYDGKTGGLPEEITAALDRIEKRLAVRNDPLYIDSELDKAMYQRIFSILKKGNETAERYFIAKADIVNYIMILRGIHMHIPTSVIRDMLVPGGSVSVAQWMKTSEKPEKLCLLLQKYGTELYRAAIQAQMDHRQLTFLEKKADDYLLSMYRPYKNRMDGPETVIGYLLQREREASAVRLVMAGKKNGFGNDVIRERLRELYA